MKNGRKHLLSHPGEILKEEFLAPLGISVYALAKAIDVPRTRMNDIVLGHRGISADTAIRLGYFFGTDAQSWLNLQSRYDLLTAEESGGSSYRNITTFEQLQSDGVFS